MAAPGEGHCWDGGTAWGWGWPWGALCVPGELQPRDIHSCAHRHARVHPLLNRQVSSPAQTAHTPTWVHTHTHTHSPTVPFNAPLTLSALQTHTHTQPLGTQHCPPPRPKPTPGLQGGTEQSRGLTPRGSSVVWGIPTSPLPSQLTPLLPLQEHTLSRSSAAPRSCELPFVILCLSDAWRLGR